jgi:hypothetical protein
VGFLAAALLVARVSAAEPNASVPTATFPIAEDEHPAPSAAPESAATSEPPAEAPPASTVRRTEPARSPDNVDPEMLVTFRTEASGASLHIDGEGAGWSGRDCSTHCTLSLPPGWYTVNLERGGKTKSFAVHLKEPSDVVVSPGSPALRGLAAGFIIVGGIAAFVGFLAGSGDPKTKPTPDQENAQGAIVAVGALGAIVAGVGIGIYLSERPKASVERSSPATAPRKSAAHRPSSLVLAPAVTAHGGGLRLGLSF